MKKQNTTAENQRRRSIPFLVFVVSFALYSVIGLFLSNMYTMEEFSSAGASAMILYRDWFGVMPKVSGAFNGILNGIVYAPVMLLCPDPGIQYRLFMVENGALYAIIPTLVYMLCERLTNTSLLNRLFVTITAGLFPAIISLSHFASGKGFGIVFTVAAFYLYITAECKKHNKWNKFWLSVAISALSAAAFFLSPALISVYIALLLTTGFIMLFRDKKPIYFFPFLFTLPILAGVDIALTILCEMNGLCNFEGEYYNLIMQSVNNGLSGFATLLAGRTYYLILSSFGLAIAGMVMCVIAIISYFRQKLKNSEEDNITLSFGLILIMSILTVFTDVFFTLGNENSFGEIITAHSLVPASLLLTVAFFLFLYCYGIKYTTAICSVAAMVLMAIPSVLKLMSRLQNTGEAEFDVTLSGELSALRPGLGLEAPVTQENLIYPLCLILALFALVIAGVCCTGIRRGLLTSIITVAAVCYTGVFTIIMPVLSYEGKGADLCVNAREINRCINSYSENKADTNITVFSTDKELAMNLQYTNQFSKVAFTESPEEIPESCYLVCEKPPENIELCILIGRVEGVSVYAIGADAIKFPQENNEDMSSDIQ